MTHAPKTPAETVGGFCPKCRYALAHPEYGNLCEKDGCGKPPPKFHIRIVGPGIDVTEDVSRLTACQIIAFIDSKKDGSNLTLHS
jgi:hypothetical protein